MNKKFYDVKETATETGLTENAIRWLIFKGDPKMEACILRNSRRILIDLEKFYVFLQQKSQERKQDLGKL